MEEFKICFEDGGRALDHFVCRLAWKIRRGGTGNTYTDRFLMTRD